MDEVLNFTNQFDNIQFLVSLDNTDTPPVLYSCNEWAYLYTELGTYGNQPLILNTDPLHQIWNMFAGSTYSAYAFIDHNMVIRYLLNMPNLYDFQNIYIPELLHSLYECEDTVDGDINIDNDVSLLDIINLVNCILEDNCNKCYDLNFDNSLDVNDILYIINIILY